MTTLEEQRNQQLQSLGDRLAQAWLSSSLIEAVADDELPVDRGEAYFVQDRMAESIGQPLSGWKVGATSARMRELDGHSDVIPGRIFQSVTWQGSRHSLPFTRFANARAETEFAFRLNADLPLRNQAWTADELSPLATFHPAIEIIGNRHLPPAGSNESRSLMTVSDNGGGIGFVFGDPIDDWRGVHFQAHAISLTVDGAAPAENFLGEMRCEPIQAVADLANHLASRGIALSAGDFISTGAATVPQAIQRGSHVVADFGHLGRIEVTFE